MILRNNNNGNDNSIQSTDGGVSYCCSKLLNVKMIGSRITRTCSNLSRKLVKLEGRFGMHVIRWRDVLARSLARIIGNRGGERVRSAIV